MSASREKRTRRTGGFLEDTTPKKPEPKKHDVLYAAIAILLAVVLVGSAGLMVWQLGIAPNLAVATIGGEGIYAHEANFYYINAYLNFANQMQSYYGVDISSILDTSTPLNQQLSWEDDGSTWHDYFSQQGLNSARQVRAFVKLAKADGMSIDDDGMAHVADELEALHEYVDTETDLNVKDYLANYYGSRMTEAEYERIVSEGYLAQQYATAKGESFTFTTEQLADYYAEHAQNYDNANFRLYYAAANAETTEEMTDEEKTAANEAAAAAALSEAQAIADAATDEESFIQLVAATYGDSDTEMDEEAAASLAEFNYTSADSSTLVSGHNYEYIAYYVNAEIADWLFEDGRANGDTTAISTTSGAYAVMYIERVKEEYNTVDVRHILFQFEKDTDPETGEAVAEATDEQKAAAKARADEVLAIYEAGDKTEDSFAALATEYTEDTGSAETGGLYERVYKGQMVENFEVWSFGTARQPGDVDIIETNYGYHIMYFVGQDLPRWEAQAEVGAKNDAFNTWQNELFESMEIVFKSGMSSVGLPNQR